MGELYKELVDIILVDIWGLLDVVSFILVGIFVICVKIGGWRFCVVVCGGVGIFIDIYK